MRNVKKELHRKGRAIFDELLLNPHFVEDIKQFRKKHHIPGDGFKSHTDYQKWKKVYKPQELSGKIIEETITLNADDNPVVEKQTKQGSVTLYHFELCILLKKYDLSHEWLPFLTTYICFNEPFKISTHTTHLARHTFRGVVLFEEITVSFGATLVGRTLINKIDGKTIWDSSIKPLQEIMQGHKEKEKRPGRAKIKQQARVYKLSKDGKSDKEIYEEMPEIEEIQTIRQHRKRFKNKIKP